MSKLSPRLSNSHCPPAAAAPGRIFGDTVNVAARMQATSEPGKCQLSPSSSAALMLSVHQVLVLVPRGEIFIKGRVS